MQHTVGDEDVGNDDLGSIHEDGAVLILSDAQLAVVIFRSERCAVRQVGRVVHAVDDVVFDDVPQIFGGEVGKGRSNVVESLVVGREDGDIAIVGRVDFVSGVDSAAE